MGEVGVSSTSGMEVELRTTEAKSEMAKAAEMNHQRENLAAEGGGSAGTAADTSSYSVVKWERFLPKMAVRVLLVEADDSTRQIIAALLRKCSYKVVAVSDGLKAWEVLRKGSENIDLILTEVELPSISGYALLTLMMEHYICKNTPVIMMSSQDSVNTVYKCMLRGAADFLVKPIRKNELRNLWQHVWRKQAKSRLAAGLGPPDESVAQENVEATAESNDVGNHSSDAQSACWKPDLETEGADTEQVNRLVPEETTKCQVNDINSNAQEESHQEHRNTQAHEDEAGDLDMKRAYPTGSVNQVNDETKRLNHSEASAFSRYVSKSLQNHNSTFPSMCYQHNGHETNARKHLSRYIPDYNSDTRARTVISQKLVSVIAIPSGQSETTFPFSQKREVSQPSPVRGVEVQNVMTGAAPLIRQTQHAPSALPPPPAPTMNNYFRPFSQLNSFYPSDHQPLVSREFHNLTDLRISKTSDHTDENQCKKFEDMEDKERFSPGNDQSVNGSSFDGQTNHYQSACSGSNGKINSISLGPKCGNEEGFNLHNEASHRSRQREAALTKFRSKRKDRCFEKKVRYESRKKLAEQRPRVKGQFVRQIASNAQPGSSSAGC